MLRLSFSRARQFFSLVYSVYSVLDGSPIQPTTMADVRALLAAERQSRRVSHPHLSYTKSGMLVCNVCNLNVKSETLWEGHLRSANHRKNVSAQASRQASLDANTGKGVKRKIEDVDEVEEDRDETETDARKKSKSQPEIMATGAETEELQAGPLPQEVEDAGGEAEHVAVPASVPDVDSAGPTDVASAAVASVNEDEWAAFEREVAPLASGKPDYTSATISAAPVTADQLKAQDDEDRRRKLETEAEDEREDEAGRLAEEFDVMEEMEERVRRLREKREALRSAVKSGHADQAALEVESNVVTVGTSSKEADGLEQDDEDEDEDEDEDDWYS